MAQRLREYNWNKNDSNRVYDPYDDVIFYVKDKTITLGGTAKSIITSKFPSMEDCPSCVMVDKLGRDGQCIVRLKPLPAELGVPYREYIKGDYMLMDNETALLLGAEDLIDDIYIF